MTNITESLKKLNMTREDFAAEAGYSVRQVYFFTSDGAVVPLLVQKWLRCRLWALQKGLKMPGVGS